jgi:hypothetical protein
MCPSTDSLTPDTILILEELTRYLNLEKLLPCYRLVITVRYGPSIMCHISTLFLLTSA